ncbi:helix-turn-helix domain-containing protein [Aquimarina litoralis]|uniref:helix-turn-helix domain-containing protein n=1 Tax=Aquimarina litoralis TaxID=584605 RepID=UPI001C58B9D5|nr:helix-turn-helix domain-containing protein [Aquimarina litoralis]MBW1297766.1 helix-turn-helix domain-containing protein [Aquimarina litoralis]
MHTVEKFSPELNKVYFIEKHTLFHILSGTGSIQVDFKNYFDWQEKAIFLEKGQYIKFLSDTFTVRRIEFSNDEKFYNTEVRVLFKHLISLGYIDLFECSECNSFLSESALAENSSDIIDISSKQWYWQNPFKANKEEYQIIFDVKDIIDQEYANNLSGKDLVSLINENGYNAQALIKNKIGLSIKNLVSSKRLQESQKQIAFTDKNIQEISYDLGFKDDAYFNRVFKNSIGQTPKQFRENFDFKRRDVFTQDILELLQKYHTTERSLEFYADKMNLSIKALSNKVKSKMNVTIGQLIRLELVNTAKFMLLEDESITAISRTLGFEEPNHFTRFFKHYAGITPSDFKSKKYNL